MAPGIVLARMREHDRAASSRPHAWRGRPVGLSPRGGLLVDAGVLTAPPEKFSAMTIVDTALFQLSLNPIALRIRAASAAMSGLQGHVLNRPRVRPILRDDASAESRLLLLAEGVTDVELAGCASVRAYARAARPPQPLPHTVGLDYVAFTADQVLRRLLPEGMEVPGAFEQVGHRRARQLTRRAPAVQGSDRPRAPRQERAAHPLGGEQGRDDLGAGRRRRERRRRAASSASSRWRSSRATTTCARPSREWRELQARLPRGVLELAARARAPADRRDAPARRRRRRQVRRHRPRSPCVGGDARRLKSTPTTGTPQSAHDECRRQQGGVARRRLELDGRLRPPPPRDGGRRGGHGAAADGAAAAARVRPLVYGPFSREDEPAGVRGALPRRLPRRLRPRHVGRRAAAARPLLLLLEGGGPRRRRPRARRGRRRCALPGAEAIVVRDVAPSKLMMCVSFVVPRRDRVARRRGGGRGRRGRQAAEARLSHKCYTCSTHAHARLQLTYVCAPHRPTASCTAFWTSSRRVPEGLSAYHRRALAR